ncbi:MAG: hypothetical protein LIP02_13020 [Bacteroidales bacterium]|nr:hypothetical protein [Bacteroidales bacterium]
MIEYGYMEGQYLRSRFIQPISRVYVDNEGKQQVETISVEQQIAELSEEWKPVDVISEEQMLCDDKNYIIFPVPYDAGDRIAYRYERRFDRQKVRNEIDALKAALADSDYKITKCYEASLLGQELPYDVASLHIERQNLRNQINELELLLQ